MKAVSISFRCWWQQTEHVRLWRPRLTVAVVLACQVMLVLSSVRGQARKVNRYPLKTFSRLATTQVAHC
jgi:hypothetical protein